MLYSWGTASSLRVSYQTPRLVPGASCLWVTSCWTFDELQKGDQVTNPYQVVVTDAYRDQLTAGTFMRKIGLGGPCPHCDTPVSVTELLDQEVVPRN